jgi:ATP-binding protein involved in chromosome partitioning
MRALNVEGGAVRFVMEIAPQQAKAYEQVKAQAETALKALDGITSVSIVMTGHSDAPPPNLKPQAPKPKGPEKIPGVARILAVASGKGGVGKSTLSSNLAVAMAQQGLKVGLLDADVYGPSQPRMLGVSGRPSSPAG